jgi:DNA processing protein
MSPNVHVDDTAIRAWLATPGHALLARDDPRYPQALLQTEARPPALYVSGRIELLNRPALAIVGSRSPTPQGRENARAFGKALADAGFAIVSGLALGIDAAAHEGGLDGAASTIAVVGTGPDIIYPRPNRALARRIEAQGVLVSEYPPGTPARKGHFPRRNRLLSGLALGVLVVEANLVSGSLITARLAGEQGRDVFAIPGSIHSPLSRGCHKLIRDGAKLVETVGDVLEEFGVVGSSAAAGRTTQADSPSSEGDGLLAALGHDPADIDSIAARSGLAADAIAATLIALEIEGRVAALPGGRWQRV